MFGSNVQPKKRIKEQRKESWMCMRCSTENAHYMAKCSNCYDHRPH